MKSMISVIIMNVPGKHSPPAWNKDTCRIILTRSFSAIDNSHSVGKTKVPLIVANNEAVKHRKIAFVNLYLKAGGSHAFLSAEEYVCVCVGRGGGWGERCCRYP